MRNFTRARGEDDTGAMTATRSTVPPMSGIQALKLLSRLEGAIGAVLKTPTRARRINAGVKGGIRTPRDTLKELIDQCSWCKVFGTKEGVVPAVSGPLPTKGEEVDCVCSFVAAFCCVETMMPSRDSVPRIPRLNMSCTTFSDIMFRSHPRTRGLVLFARWSHVVRCFDVGKQKYDSEAMLLLTPELRKTFAALWVEGDGNCFWRAVSKAL